MVRGSSSKKRGEEQNGEMGNPEGSERKRLKDVAFSNNILSDNPTRNFTALGPSKLVIKHHGKDILRKSQRKNRFLFSFPGLVAPIGGGKIGELKDLGTKNPILYLDFPQGQMKLFGTIVYPQNRYLTLQFSRGGKSVVCEDYFDNLIVFSDAWWIGRKDENPEEARLDFPKELIEGQHMEYDFKGGAGAASLNKQAVPKPGIKYVEEQSPEVEFEDGLSDGEIFFKDKMEVTPVRHSERNAGKKFKFADVGSEDDPVGSDTDTSEGEENKFGVKLDSSTENNTVGKSSNSCFMDLDIDNEDAAEKNQSSKQVQVSTTPTTKSKNLSQSAVSVTKEGSRSNHGSLVQTTISTLFKKVEEKKAPRNSRKSSSSKVSEQKLQQNNLKRKIDQAEGPRKKGKVIEGKNTGVKGKKKGYEAEDDDIEEFSSSTQDTNGSDEDWAA